MWRDRFGYDCVIRASGAWSLCVWRFSIICIWKYGQRRLTRFSIFDRRWRAADGQVSFVVRRGSIREFVTVAKLSLSRFSFVTFLIPTG